MIDERPAAAGLGSRLRGRLGACIGGWIASTAITGCPARIDDTRHSGTTPRPDPTVPAPAVHEPPPQSTDTTGELAPAFEPPPSRPVVAALQRVFGSRPASAEAVDTAFGSAIEWTAPLDDTRRDDLDVREALRGDTPAATRILDLGRSVVVAQLQAVDGSTSVLILEIEDERVTAVRRYGAPVLGASPPATPLPVAIADGRPSVRNVSITRKLYDAASVREWHVWDGLVAARATHAEAGGATSMLAGLQALLRDDDTITIRRHYAAGRYVVVEALVTRAGGPVRTPVAAFVDVLRLDGEQVVASERYVNRRPPR